jgi:ferric-dicitrate binding protein FerR (iron transport regulator)
MNEQEITELFNRFFAGTITPGEKQLLAEWITKADKQALAPQMHQAWKEFTTSETIPADKANQLLNAIIQKKSPAIDPEPRVLNLGMRRKYWFAAAAVLAVICCTAIYWFKSSPQEAKPTAIIKKELAPPAVSNAVLTLANGKKIMLDSAQNGSLARQGKTDLIKLSDGQIAYRGQDAGAGLQWNTLTVPRGSKIAAITLADGTQVWLNAGSSLTYPVAFTGKERRVSVTGETYFEVAKDHVHPFIVQKGDNRVQVFGTHFNVHAYEDESDIQITLLEGSIEVSNGETKHKIVPGQMALIQPDRSIRVTDSADLDRVMAWRNGRFDFADADIGMVMRELARWYDVEIEYREPVNEKFYLETNRNINVSDVFKILETTGGVHFLTEGKKIIVMR